VARVRRHDYTPAVDFVGILATTLTLTALFSYVNRRWLRVPRAIGFLLMGLTVSLVIVAVGRWLPALQQTALATMAAIDFDRLVLRGVLGVLLFAGALHLDIADLRKHALVIGVLSTAGVIVSTGVVGWLMWHILGWLGLGVPLLACLLFGALSSPTDPIAVFAIVRALRVPKDLEVQISGESLFNDGIGVVVFLTLLRLVGGPDQPPTAAGLNAALVLIQEVVGGALFGAVVGAVAYLLIKSVDDYRVEILLSLALVLGGYTLAQALGVSAPIAIVVAGLLIGNAGRAFAMSAETRERLDGFWEVVDEILNAVLFVLIGLQLLTVVITPPVLVAGVAAIVVTLLARGLAVGLPLVVLRRWTHVPAPRALLLTWGGIRGPLSIALALSLHQRITGVPASTTDVLVVMTYLVVVFSVTVQGLTLKPLIARALRRAAGV
jgi:CPA1 family monovalent cation:H+ antiporter